MRPRAIMVLMGAVLVFSFPGRAFVVEGSFQITECILKDDAGLNARLYTDRRIAQIEKDAPLSPEEKEQIRRQFNEMFLNTLGRAYLIVENPADCPSGMSLFRPSLPAHSDK